MLQSGGKEGTNPMKTIEVEQLAQSPGLYEEVAKVLREGGLVCLPCGGSYRVVGDVLDANVVTRLLQSKRRTKYAPSLVFVGGVEQLPGLVTGMGQGAERLVDAFWPGTVTILFEPDDSLAPKVRKQLTKANKHIGVRVPADEVARSVVAAFGGPLLVSSANHQNRAGAASAAQVRKNFSAAIDLFLHAGDLKPAAKSTVVRIKDGAVEVTRPGSVTEEQIAAAVEG